MPKADISDLATLAATGGPRPDAFDGRLAYVNSKLCVARARELGEASVRMSRLSADESPRVRP